MGRGCWHPSPPPALWDKGSRHPPTPWHPWHAPQHPMLTLRSASVGPVLPVLAACSWVQAMMGEVKVSVGLRAGCRLTLPTCCRAEQWAGGSGSPWQCHWRGQPPSDTDLLAVPCPPGLGAGGWQHAGTVREQILMEVLDGLHERGQGEVGVPETPQLPSCCHLVVPGLGHP